MLLFVFSLFLSSTSSPFTKYDRLVQPRLGERYSSKYLAERLARMIVHGFSFFPIGNRDILAKYKKNVISYYLLTSFFHRVFEVAGTRTHTLHYNQEYGIRLRLELEI